MNDHTKGYLEGLQAAALICQENAGERNSHLSDKIMALHSRKVLEGEIQARNEKLDSVWGKGLNPIVIGVYDFIEIDILEGKKVINAPKIGDFGDLNG